MSFFSWRKLFGGKTYFSPKPRTMPIRRQPASHRPLLEVLEDRTLLTAPVVSALTPAGIFNQTPVAAWGGTQIKVSFSKTPVNAEVLSNYLLSSAGNDHVLGTSDDVTIALQPVSIVSTSTRGLNLPSALTPDLYRLIVLDNITDTSNVKLDGDANGTAGGNFVRDFTVIPAAAATFTVSGFPTTVASGTTGNVTVTANDAFGNIATGYVGTVTLTSTSSSAVLTPSVYTFTSTDAGVHTFQATLQGTGTNKSITATDTAGITGKESGITVTAATSSTVSSIVVTAYPGATTAGDSHTFDVKLQDSAGHQVVLNSGDTVPVHLTSTDPSIVFSQTDFTFTAADAGDKVFSATFKTVGTQSITVTDTANSVAGTESGIGVVAAAAKTFVVSGFANPTTAGVSQSFTVTAFDAYSNIATGYVGTVDFTSNDSAAILPTDYTFLASDAGVHTFQATLVTAGSSKTITATDTVTATVLGKQLGIIVNPAAADHYALVSSATATAGTPFNVSLTALDAFGNVANNYLGTVHFTSSDAAAVLPTDYAFTAADASTKNFLVTLKTAGTQSFTITGTDGLTAFKTGISVTPASAVKTFVVSAFAGTTTAGVSQGFTVSAVDSFGNIVSGYTGTVHFTSTDSSALLPADYTFLPTDAGVNNFRATLFTVGSRSITATDVSLASITGKQQGIIVTAAQATNLVVNGFPSTISAGTSASFTVTAKDAFGNVATGYVGTLAFNSSAAVATLPANYVFTTADAGVHSFSATLYSAGSQSITATDTNVSTITGKQSAIAVTVQSAGTISVSGYPTTVSAGTAQNYEVIVRDSFGNIYSNFTGVIHFSSSDPQAVLPADYTFKASDFGDKIFSATLKTSGFQSITATDLGNGTTGLQDSIAVTAGAIKNFNVTGYPSPTTAGTNNSFSVTAFDNYGNTVTGYTGTVHFTSTDIGSNVILPVDYTFTSTDAGVHSFSAKLVSAGTRTLTVTDAGNSAVFGKQQGIQVNAAATSSMVVGGFANPVTAGTPGAFTVTVKDSFGNIATGYVGTVHFTSSDLGASLPVDYKFTVADAGIRTFSATLYSAGSQTIIASDVSNPAIIGKQSAISITSAGGTTVSVTNFPTTTIAGVSNNFLVRILDPFGNAVTSYVGTVHFTSDDPQAVLPTDYTFTSGPNGSGSDNGSHTFSATLKTAGIHVIRLNDVSSPVIAGSEAGISVLASTVKTLGVTGFANPTVAQVPGTFIVTALDAYGNPTGVYTGTVHFTSTDTLAQLPSDYQFKTADAGTHSFSGTLFSQGARTITATDTVTATILGKQQNIQVVGGAATYFVVSTPATVSTASPFDVTVTAKDQFGNVASGYVGTVTFASSDTIAVLPPDYTFTVADGGVHTFSSGVTLFAPPLENVFATDTVAASITGKSSTTVSVPGYFYLPSTNTIYINGLSATLTLIKQSLPDAPLSVDSVTATWYLGAKVLLQNGATLTLHGTSIGGDVNWLKLKSDNTHDSLGNDLPSNTVWIKAIYGTIDIDTTKVTTWGVGLDGVTVGVDTNPGIIPPRKEDENDGDPSDVTDHTRSFISVRSYFAADGITPLESTLNIKNSTIAYLGSHNTEAYGLSWKALGVGPEIHAKLHVYGNMINCDVHDLFFGAFIYGGYNMTFQNNRVYNNVWYGLDPHDDTNNSRFIGNYLYDNGTHGIILSKRCDNNIVQGNYSYDNRFQGIMLHRSCDNNLVSNNFVYDNGGDGIAIYESFHNTIIGNTVHGNYKGIRLSMGAAYNTVGDPVNPANGNVIYSNLYDGIDFLTGNDIPDPAPIDLPPGETGDTDRRAHDDVVANNIIHDNASYGIRVSSGKYITFLNNTLFNESLIYLITAPGNVFDGNTLPSNLTITSAGSSTEVDNTLVRNQTSTKVQVDSYSTFTFGDTAGTILDTGISAIATSITPSGSQMLLNRALIGPNPFLVLARSLKATIAGGAPNASVTPTSWPSDPNAPLDWTTRAGSSTEAITYTMSGLAANGYYVLSKPGSIARTVQADASGLVTFVDIAGTVAPVAYELVRSNTPSLPPVQAANVSYSASTNTITISGPVSATFTQLKALVSATLLLNPTPYTWYLKANLVLKNGASLVVAGSAIGGDTDQLRLRSNSSTVLGSVVSIKANYGYLTFDHTSVTSWNDALNGGVGGVDTEYATYQRAYISATSVLDANGVTAHNSSLNVISSDMGYLGFSDSNPGLMWTVSSTNTTVLGNVHVFGNVRDSHIHDSYYGLDAVNAFGGLTFINNEIDHNALHGVYFKSLVSAADVESNYIHDNGGTGIYLAATSDHVIIRNNTIGNTTVSKVQQNGIIVQAGSTFALITGNTIGTNATNALFGNAATGLLISGSNSAIVSNNVILNSVYGVRIDKSTSLALVSGNEIGNNSDTGVYILVTSNNNTISNNNIHDNTLDAVKISASNNNLLQGNIITGVASQNIDVVNATGNRFTANSFSANTTFKSKGAIGTFSQTFIVDQSKEQIYLDAYSTVNLSSSTGAAYKVGASTLATNLSTTSSTLTLTSANIGKNVVVLITARHLSATVNAGVATVDSSLWDSNPANPKSFVLRAGSTTQSAAFTLGDLTPGAHYTIKKNNVVLLNSGVPVTLIADSNGYATFTDVAGTLSPVTYSIVFS